MITCFLSKDPWGAHGVDIIARMRKGPNVYDEQLGIQVWRQTGIKCSVFKCC